MCKFRPTLTGQRAFENELEYRSLACLPADQFIPVLMKRLDLPYYAGLLSAAQATRCCASAATGIPGLPRKKPVVRVRGVRVAILARKGLAEVPVQNFNTPRGTLLVSSPEATALDLVGYAHHAGGLSHVATVLSELAERIDPEKLAAAARTAPVAWAQRLEYLLKHLGSAARTPALKEYVCERAKQSTALLPKARRARSRRNKGWKLYINA
jgi:transcriptional regulator with AbiEi antitoxin domain of type IV toxin-antitoxin system